ncbi:MAG TPA: A/G-specific adenine glycosylase [Kiritimatiellia bacterium]|nr:A/G-specific adenine glycosylase [Kiritimatiellia bacterium]HMO51436.1 A/G-specific adenine glycosylase [Kiritimatiellia bacterium]HMO97861.1 A/G-specific adenine glycosylase [Kiritimatiellia bacterium]
MPAPTPKRTAIRRPPIRSSDRRVFHEDLLAWFQANRRALPWRKKRTPYRVWISELMLQQTRADQAIPYFDRFMRRFPTLTSLAEAPRQDVLKAWEGLGYYSRAVRAHETAKQVLQRGGDFPGTYEELLALPGVGSYTAAAIASLAYGLDHAVLDGNVIRVLSRVLAVEAPADKPATRRLLQDVLDRILPVGRAADFNEAMMELGALVCTPRSPKCPACPFAPICRARRNDQPERFPVKSAKPSIPHRHVGAGVIIDDRGRVLIARRKEASMLGGLWEFPGGGVEEGESLPQCITRELKEELDLEVRVGPHLTTVRHTFSHFRMDLHAYWVRVNRGKPKAIGCDGWAWVQRDRIADYPLPRADQKILRVLEKAGDWPEF